MLSEAKHRYRVAVSRLDKVETLRAKNTLRVTYLTYLAQLSCQRARSGHKAAFVTACLDAHQRHVGMTVHNMRYLTF